MGWLEKKLSLFFLIQIFLLLLQVSKYRISSKTQKSLILQEKIAKFELGHQKRVLDERSSTLEFFLVKCVHIFFWSKNIIFSTLTLYTPKKINLEKRSEI